MAVEAKDLIAIYAAVVSTSALFLNFKSWLDSGVKLKFGLIADGMIIGGGEELDEKDLVILNVTNRGDSSTTIENMVLFEMPSWWRRLLKRPSRTFVVANPQVKGYPQNVPSELEPAKKWTGVIRNRPDMIPDIRNGNFYAGIYASHCDKPYLFRIVRKQKLPEDTQSINQ